jgi:hypothetical protein
LYLEEVGKAALTETAAQTLLPAVLEKVDEKLGPGSGASLVIAATAALLVRKGIAKVGTSLAKAELEAELNAAKTELRAVQAARLEVAEAKAALATAKTDATVARFVAAEKSLVNAEISAAKKIPLKLLEDGCFVEGTQVVTGGPDEVGGTADAAGAVGKPDGPASGADNQHGRPFSWVWALGALLLAAAVGVWQMWPSSAPPEDEPDEDEDDRKACPHDGPNPIGSDKPKAGK